MTGKKNLLGGPEDPGVVPKPVNWPVSDTIAVGIAYVQYYYYNVSGGIVTNTCGDRTRVLPGS